MLWKNGRRSDNIEDQRASGPRPGRRGGLVGGGIGTIVLALVAMYFGIDPSVVLNTAMTDPAPVESTQQRPEAENAQARFVSMVLADTEDTWRVIFQQGGATYREPKLVLYTGATRSACGSSRAAHSCRSAISSGSLSAQAHKRSASAGALWAWTKRRKVACEWARAEAGLAVIEKRLLVLNENRL